MTAERVAPAVRLPGEPLGRPIRVVLFCGPALEPGPVRFAERLEGHPEVELLAVFCETPGLGPLARMRDLVRRRGLLAGPIALAGGGRSLTRAVRSPVETARARRSRRAFRARLEEVPSLHAPEVVDRLRGLDPDLTLSYGGPIVRAPLLELPRFGALGIHHGRFPDYRGKKATLRALLADEAGAGVTIQHLGERIDDGPVVARGEVPARGRSLARVEAELDDLGLDLFLEAVLRVARGEAEPRTVEGTRGPLHRDPGVAELARHALRRARAFVPGAAARDDGPVPDEGGGGPAGADSPGVLLLTESFHPAVGGGETQARDLAIALREGGMRVRILTRRWDPAWPELELFDGVPVHRLPPTGGRGRGRWGLARRVRPVVARFRADHPVAVVNGFRVLGIPALLERRRSRPGTRPLRVVLKADSPGEFSGAFFDGGLGGVGLSHRSLPVRPLLAWRNRLLRGADAFVAISSPIEEELLRHGVEAERVHRIPNGVDTARFRPPRPGEREAMRARFGLPAESTIAVFTGRLVRYKGLPLLVRVWQGLAPLDPDAHLVIAGEGSADLDACEDELHALVRSEAIPRIHFTGATAEVPELLRAADLFVFPSEHEAFGISVIEAMATGLPIVATRAGGLADLVEEPQGALAVRAGDAEELGAALSRLLSDPALRARLGEAGRRAALERYALDRVRDAWIELLEKVGDG